MAFWRIGNNFANTSAIDKLLEKPDHTLIEVLEEQDLLPELMAPNTKLVEYLRAPEILHQLVNMVIDPALDAEQSLEGASKDGSNNETNDASIDSSADESADTSTKFDDSGSNISMSAINHDNEVNEKDNHDENLNPSNIENPEDEDEEPRSNYDEEDSRQQLADIADIAAEILSADVWSITEALMEDTSLIDEIWGILDYHTPLSMAHASYFTKISEHLLDKKTEEMLVFIKKQDNFVERFMKHIDNPPLMDFLLKVISSDKPENSTGIIELLQRQKLIPSLISFLGPDISSSVQSAAGDFLKAFVTISANSNSDNTTIGPNELSRELVSEPCIRELVRLMLFGGSGLATGVGVVIEIIRKNNSDYDFVPVMYTTIESHPPTSRDPIYLGTLVKIFSENIPKLNEMLIRKHDEVIKTPFGQIEPLGFERFKICELVAELLHCSNMALLNDSGGEAIVAARDAERIRVIKSQAESSSGVTSLDEKFDPKESFSTTIPEEDEKDEVEPLAEDLSSLSLERPEENDGDASVPSEASLRVNPVVGDQLKITLADSQVITHILEMFFKFPWNNFLHNVVFDIVQQVLNGPMAEGYNRYLAIDLFQSGRLTYLICEGHENCAKYEEKTKCRLGYMGHLTLISEEVVKFTAVYSPETISPVVEKAVEDPEWVKYVSETLAHTREQYNSILGGQRPEDSQDEMNPDDDMLVSSQEGYDDEQQDEEMNDINDAKDDGSDKFSRYVSQQMMSQQMNESRFGSSDEEEDDEDEQDDRESKESKVQLLGSDADDDEDDDEDSGLDLVRSKSIHS